MHDESGGRPKAMPSIAWLINVQEIEPFYKNFPPFKIKTARSGFYTSKAKRVIFFWYTKQHHDWIVMVLHDNY